MLVKDLIKHLSEMDENLPVLIGHHENEWHANICHWDVKTFVKTHEYDTIFIEADTAHLNPNFIDNREPPFKAVALTWSIGSIL